MPWSETPVSTSSLDKTDSYTPVCKRRRLSLSSRAEDTPADIKCEDLVPDIHHAALLNPSC
ncbi:hypothetical protein WMY93_026794 [Mugilogobius chulae]|uniref:T-box transcription factor-associated domain-containing protein n=1 Tax=Mugilogobius chulae TaxID=88201 RepID=A0AAW0N8K2_9GOBI